MDTPTPTLHDLSVAIQRLEIARESLALPDLIDLDSRISVATRSAVINPNLTGELKALMVLRADAAQQHTKAAELDRELQRLHEQREIAEEQLRRSNREAQERQRGEILSEYKHAVLQAARAYRRCLNAKINPGDFHASILFSAYWNGTLGDAMRQGPLPFETDSLPVSKFADQKEAA